MAVAVVSADEFDSCCYLCSRLLAEKGGEYLTLQHSLSADRCSFESKFCVENTLKVLILANLILSWLFKVSFTQFCYFYCTGGFFFFLTSSIFLQRTIPYWICFI